MNVTAIFEGWVNYITQPSSIKEIAEKRGEHCVTCPFRKEMGKLQICGKCGCPLAAKLMSKKSYCPIGLWKHEA